MKKLILSLGYYRGWKILFSSLVLILLFLIFFLKFLNQKNPETAVHIQNENSKFFYDQIVTQKESHWFLKLFC